MTPTPLPVAPRPYPDETLRSWANRVGAWYGLSGTGLVNALRSRAVLPEADDFSSLEDCEHDGVTPRWVMDLLADAARLPRAQIHALCQDGYARWMPPWLLWNALGANRSGRCWRCLAACGEDHERRAWRAGWTSVRLEHGVVLDTRHLAPSPYAVQLEGALHDAIHHGGGWVGLPWPVDQRPLGLPVSLLLLTLATLAEYLCDEAEAIVYGPLGELASTRGHRERSPVPIRLIDIAAHAARACRSIREPDRARIVELALPEGVDAHPASRCDGRSRLVVVGVARSPLAITLSSRASLAARDPLAVVPGLGRPEFRRAAGARAGHRMALVATGVKSSSYGKRWA